jgi:hypothetical protein
LREAAKSSHRAVHEYADALRDAAPALLAVAEAARAYLLDPLKLQRLADAVAVLDEVEL